LYIHFPIILLPRNFSVYHIQPTIIMVPTSLLIMGVTLLNGPQLVMSAVQLPKAQQKQVAMTSSSPTSDRLKVPGESPAYYCSDPSDDIFQIDHLDFIPTNPRVCVLYPGRPLQDLQNKDIMLIPDIC
jgi:hypothetical protein